MDLDWIYYFHAGETGDRVLSELMQIRESGEHLGSTYSPDRTHRCFSRAHIDKLEQVLAKYPGLQFEKCPYFDGDVDGEDFGISTFRQPLVQWCPPVILTKLNRVVIDAEESWGLSTDGLVVLCSDLRSVADAAIAGLTRLSEKIAGPFDLYSIDNDNVEIPHEIIPREPLRVKGDGLPQADIFRLGNGIILLSQAFAGILKKYWDGYMHVKFGPVITGEIPPRTKKFLCRRLKTALKADKSVLEGIREIENHVGFEFPGDYVQWITGRPKGILPAGWLSPRGGLSSEMWTNTKTNQEESDPPMPGSLVAINANGAGDYFCVQEPPPGMKEGVFVWWDHETGGIDGSYGSYTFSQLLAEIGE